MKLISFTKLCRLSLLAVLVLMSQLSSAQYGAYDSSLSPDDFDEYVEMDGSNFTWELNPNTGRWEQGAAPIVIECEDQQEFHEFTDDGGIQWNYNEDVRTRVWTFCPSDPSCELLEIEFTSWDVGTPLGDLEEEALYGVNAESILGNDFFTVADAAFQRANSNRDLIDEDGTNANREAFTQFFPLGETGATDAPNGGIVSTTCDNGSGCISILFNPDNHDNDNEIGAGWSFKVQCNKRPVEVTAPNDGSIPSIHLLQGLGVCAYQGIYTAGPIALECAPNSYTERYGIGFTGIAPRKDRNGLPLFDLDELAGFDVIEDARPGDQIPVFPVLSGLQADEFTGCFEYYALYITDLNGNGVEDEYEAGKYDFQTLWLCPPALVCNDELNVALNSDCVGTITPDHVLEDPCLLDLLHYAIRIKDEAGNVIANNEINKSHLGQTITVEVIENRLGGALQPIVRNSCETKLNIQDNIPPRVVAPDHAVIYCTTDLDGESDPRDIYGFRIDDDFQVYDNCGADLEIGPWVKEHTVCSDYADPVRSGNTIIGYDVTGDGVLDIPAGKFAGANLDNRSGLDLFDFSGNGDFDGLMCVYKRTYKVTDQFRGTMASDIQYVYVIQPYTQNDTEINNIEIEGFDPPFAIGEGDEYFGPLYWPYNATLDGCADDAIATPEHILANAITGNFSGAPLALEYASPYLVQPEVRYIGAGDDRPTSDVRARKRSLLDHPVCGWAIVYEDSEKIPTKCGYKIFREWKVYDWCFGTFVNDANIYDFDGVAVFNQVIKVEDNEAPTISCPRPEGKGANPTNPYIVGTNGGPFSCTANVVLGQPTASDNCDDSPEVELLGIFKTSNNALVGTDFTKLPLEGCETGYYAMWRAKDDCGNLSANCRTYFKLIDDDAPVAVADEYTVLPTGEEDHGAVTVCATNLDSGSYDNCSDEVAIAISKKASGPFVDCVTISCDDVAACNGALTLWFKATDDCDNESTVMVQVELQDKIKPTIVGGPNKNVTCEEKDPYSLFNTPVAADNCDKNPAVELIRETGSFDSCGNGSVTRTWEATDACGNKAQTSQTVTSTHVSDYVVTFPADIDEECVGNNYEFDASDVIVSDDDCENILIRHSDKVYTGVEDACYKIIRTIEVINWCAYDVLAGEPSSSDDTQLSARRFRDGGDGYIKYVQQIIVKDFTAPVIEDHADVVVDDQTDGCEGKVTLDITASDACTGTENLSISWRIDAFFGTADEIAGIAEGTGSSVTNVFPYGTHRITFWVQDGCGNTAEEDYLFTIRDRKKPGIVCVSFLSAELMPIDTDGDNVADNGMAEVWASEYVQSYSDNCEECKDDCFLIEDITATGETGATPGADAADVLAFTCDDLGSRRIAVWAKDAAGNWDVCTAFLELQNNMGACGDAKASIAVAIQTEMNQDVEGAKIDITGMDASFTNHEGALSMLAPLGGTYTVTPEKVDSPLNGVSTRDIVLISQHILGTKEFTSPYQLIAADANNSANVTVSDMGILRRLILNVDSDFENNTSWRFVDKAYEFNTPTNPWAAPFAEVVTINGLTTDAAADFIGVKIGDVDGNAVGAQPRNAVGTMTFNANDADIAAGQEYTVEFTSADLANVAGYQFTMAFDQSTLEFIDVEAGALAGLTESNFGLTRVDEGVITTSYNTTDMIANDEVLFAVTFVAKSDVTLSEAISVNSRYTAAEAYDANLSALDVAIEFGTTVVAEGFELFQNAPNPFTTETRIGFNLSEAGAATMTIMDISGKTLKVINGEYAKGYNEVTLNRSELSGAGVLYYQLNTANNSATRKMIVVE